MFDRLGSDIGQYVVFVVCMYAFCAALFLAGVYLLACFYMLGLWVKKQFNKATAVFSHQKP